MKGTIVPHGAPTAHVGEFVLFAWLTVCVVTGVTNAQCLEWEEVLPAPTPRPAPVAGHAMAYDSDRNVAVLFGGVPSPGTEAHSETWEWNCADGTWTQASPASSPPAKYAHAMAYDSGRQVVVLFGGGSPRQEPGNETNDTWEYYDSGGATWTWRQVPPKNDVPRVRLAHAMAYDSNRGVTVLFGGHDAGTRLNDTWEWDGNAWTPKATTGPSPREYPAMAYDQDCKVVLLFGGQDGGSHADTWAWDGQSWADVTPGGGSPSPRYGSVMSYGSGRNRMVLFGGGSALDDTWEYVGDCPNRSWTEVPTRVRPPGRHVAGMVFDGACSRMVLFGGSPGGSPRFDDTWLYPADTCGACCRPDSCIETTELGCETFGAYRGDGTTCEEEECPGIPTVSEWGLIVMTLLVLTAGTLVYMQRQPDRA